MNSSIRSRLVLLTIVIVAGVSTPLFATDSVFHFCSAKIEAQKKYFVTELFPGKIQIVMTSELRMHLMEKLGLDSVSVKCFSYGNDEKPAGYELAEKLRNLEIRKNSISAEVELLEWPPE